MDFKLKYEGLWVETKNVNSLPTGSWRFQRPTIKNEKCCRCGWCHIFCPTGSIQEDDDCFVIDLESCKGCGICASICPNLAIGMAKEITE